MEQISNDEWFEANLNPNEYRFTLGMDILDLPSDEIQLRFNGRAGRENLQQAFDFYKFILANMHEGGMDRQRVLDFGGGWGRVLRFFLQGVSGGELFLVDCLTAAIECARSLNTSLRYYSQPGKPAATTPGRYYWGLLCIFCVFTSA
jgi:hypothetical protein